MGEPTDTPAATRVRITPNLFGIAFGLAGLGACWQLAHSHGWAPGWPAPTLFCAAALAWLVLVVSWALQFRPGRSSLAEELRHPVFGPFVALLPIVGVLLSGEFADYAPTAGKVLVDVWAVVVIALGAWLTAGWILDDFTIDNWHPGYFLPTVAGGLLSAAALAAVGQPGPAQAAFGIGMICWLALGSIILVRLFVRAPLPAALLPTLAIEIAPPVVAANAYLALDGGRLDFVAWALAGYGVLMALVQLRLIRAYRKLPFSPGFWAFTFSYAAAAGLGMRWIGLSHLPDAAVFGDVVLGLITLFIGAIAVRTVLGLVRGTFLPRVPA